MLSDFHLTATYIRFLAVRSTGTFRESRHRTMKYEAARRAKSGENLENAGHRGIISPYLGSGAIEIFIRDVWGSETGQEGGGLRGRQIVPRLDRPAGPFRCHDYDCDLTREISSDSVKSSRQNIMGMIAC